MLRGVQTPGELKQRSERLHSFGDLDGVHSTLDGLVERGMVIRHPRRPGQKEERYEQLLGGHDGEQAESKNVPLPAPPEDRLGRLEGELTELREQVEALRRALGE
jgi:uncharacterized protein YceH (UPF0502 family)